ncbi:uncharacterized protein BP5553_01132 [Venustampulla echinocandica]|uniref:Uncharacterized protein n=1 Tax=Venustampulla echinocandica TaxID=2656787 RepID=A0A370U065_9HELO|nr:uncharacterized protein BP5553_01132 [Venustampulla echinocandica]RDL41153.1 hypothetical protein BP5553_01132 [Venustampulla echinocandica]
MSHGSHFDRVCHWTNTGEHVFSQSFHDGRPAGSTTVSETMDHYKSNVEDESESSSEQSDRISLTGSSTRSSECLLAGCGNDALEPTVEQIYSTFAKGHSRWSACVVNAEQLPYGWLPPWSLNPSIMMQNVPPLPADLRGKRDITGNTLWNIPSPELRASRSSESNNDAYWNPALVHGARKTFYLFVEKPTICGMATGNDSFRSFCNDDQPTRPNGLVILTLCWSYIFSIKLLEMQRRRMEYSTAVLLPVTCDFETQHPKTIMHLGQSSSKLVRWLCAVLAPSPGWFAKGSVPPWTAYFNQDIPLIIGTDISYNEISQETPPSSSEAVELLIELCSLYNFSSQPLIAFSIALLIPFYNVQGLQPLLPMPRFPAFAKSSHNPPLYLRDYVYDLRYYMTISVCPYYIGSMLWSVFWEPGIDCNAVSAWVGSIHQVLEPALQAVDTKLLANVFALYRPELAPLWLGLFASGCIEICGMIRSYLTNLTEHPYSPSLAHPDPNVAAWTGSKQSFLDEECSVLYESQSSLVSRADLLRHRFNFRPRDSAGLYFGWQPFGAVAKAQVEPELWPRLESRSSSRSYVYWVWWVNGEKVVERGLFHDRPQLATQKRYLVMPWLGSKHESDYVQASLNQLETDPTGVVVPSLRLTPSKEATFRILDWGSKLASGDRTVEAMAIPGVRKHVWLADAREIS